MIITIPINSSEPFPDGSVITFCQDGTGSLTFVAGSGVTIKTEVGLNINNQYGVAAIIKVAENTWRLTGSLKA